MTSVKISPVPYGSLSWFFDGDCRGHRGGPLGDHFCFPSFSRGARWDSLRLIKKAHCAALLGFQFIC